MNVERIEELRAAFEDGKATIGGLDFDHLLRCAEAMAKLERFELVTVVATNEKGVSIQATRGVSYTRGDLPSAILAAVEKAKETT